MNNDSKTNIVDLSVFKQKEYYENLKKQCLLLKENQFSFGQDLISKLYPIIRNYPLEIQGEENIPKDTNVLFVANHSNSHDIFTAYEIFSLLQRRGSVMVAKDCLNLLTTQIFNISNATLLDRKIADSRKNSVLELSNKIIQGNDGLIFGEGTWNIHPTLPMHNIHNGAAKVSLISQVPIIPVVFEYIENDEIVTTENKLFKKCVIRFGKPIYTNYYEKLSMQSDLIKQKMKEIRTGIWRDYQIVKDNIYDIDPKMYVNHTFVKKFKALGFTYDSNSEKQFLLFLGNEERNNEYTINEKNVLVPGITEKNIRMRKL